MALFFVPSDFFSLSLVSYYRALLSRVPDFSSG